MQPRFNIERERHNRLFYKEYENDKCILQFHSHIELYFVDFGEMEFLVNGHYRILTAGQMSVALSYDSHAYKTPESSRSSVLIIPVYMCEHFISAVAHKKASYPFITDSSVVGRIKECVKQLKRDGINEIERMGYIHVILGIIMDSIFIDGEQATPSPDLSSRILIYLNENFKSDITLEGVSQHFGYTKSYLSRYFSASFGIGFCQYLSALRLKNALTLINEKKHSITECAFESGFNSVRSFYRVFYSEFGCSPREYIAESEKNNTLEKIERK
jgi:AraC-like DNA-binding protein